MGLIIKGLSHEIGIDKSLDIFIQSAKGATQKKEVAWFGCHNK